MKKSAFLLAVFIAFSVLTGCSSPEEVSKTEDAVSENDGNGSLNSGDTDES